MIVLLAASILLLSVGAAEAHEFWIEPREFRVDPGRQIVAALRVGERFEGPSHAYLPQQTRRFELVAGGRAQPVTPRMGDRPALRQAPVEEGLNVVVHVTEDRRLTWDDFDAFRDFVAHKDARWVLAAHAARGLPRDEVTEAYSRYAKALVAVGDGAGADAEAGLETEIVALDNPYVTPLEALPVRLLYRGAPRPDAQIEVFARSPDGAVEVETVRTDARGEARVPLRPGHEYLLDAVVLREPAPDLAAREDVMWESLWASLTFAVPAPD